MTELTVQDTRPDAQTSGQASSADSTANGDRIGAWPIIRPLSHGGQAHIYIIDYQGKEAVLKLYDQEPKEKIFGQLKEISKSAGDLVVDILETGHFTEPGKLYDNRWFEIQEYMQEGSMDNLIKTGSSLNESEFDSLVSQLTEALIFLHNKNIIHRDLKPANILLWSRQPLKIALTDFGISSLLADNASEKLTGMAHSTFYAPPEAFLTPDGKKIVAGKAWDWWSLGVTLLEILTKKHPLGQLINEEMVPREIFNRGLQRTVPDNLPWDASVLIKGLLVNDDQKRWHGEQVRQWLAGPPYPLVSENQTEKSFNFKGQKYSTLAELAAAFAQKENWKDGKGILARGRILQWLEANSLFGEASELELLVENGPGPDANLSSFILKYNPDLGLIYKGLPLTFNHIVKYITDTSQSEAEASLVTELAAGKLRNLPRLAQEAGQLLDELTATFLRFSGRGGLSALRAALRPMERPSDFIWGHPGPPKTESARLKFALEAETPLLSVHYWRNNIPKRVVLPEEIVRELGNPATYRSAREKLEQFIREGTLETATNVLARLFSGIQSRYIRLPGLSSPVYIVRLRLQDYIAWVKERQAYKQQQDITKRQITTKLRVAIHFLCCLILLVLAFVAYIFSPLFHWSIKLVAFMLAAFPIQGKSMIKKHKI